jgi:uncharacterized protein YdiU (UPF0061 family)
LGAARYLWAKEHEPDMQNCDNSYARLPERFFAPLQPMPVAQAQVLALNTALAERLGLPLAWLRGDEGRAMLAGNAYPSWASPIAQAYAGHQFGGFVPSLGDGRAALLAEVITADGRVDLALKGSGPTPFSRGGDGRAWLGPVLREYLLSEAMAALGVPTTRALAVVATGETVLREGPRPGAVLARVAASHIRIGTFEYFAARGDFEALELLTNHALDRHYPLHSGALALFEAVVEAQARLVAQWMSLGFVHGVMNTDNMTISGETIDYGPCAFLDAYHPDTVFSAIDRHGRYAYGAQPDVAMWNLSRLASALLALIGPQEAAIAAATASLARFGEIYQAQWLTRFAAKLGIQQPRPEDRTLIEDLLKIMAKAGADFTRVFAGLADGRARDEFAQPEAFDRWAQDWRARLEGEPAPQALMRATNPLRIARNHRVQEVISAATEGDMAPFERLHAALTQPYHDSPDWAHYALAPRPEERVLRTYCGT